MAKTTDVWMITNVREKMSFIYYGKEPPARHCANLRKAVIKKYEAAARYEPTAPIDIVMSKYGPGCFDGKLLRAGVPIEDAKKVKHDLIHVHGTLHPEGYNVRGGGSKTRPVPPEPEDQGILGRICSVRDAVWPVTPKSIAQKIRDRMRDDPELSEFLSRPKAEIPKREVATGLALQINHLVRSGEISLGIDRSGMLHVGDRFENDDEDEHGGYAHGG